MVEITPGTTGYKSRRRLEELPADPNDVGSSAQRDPIQVDSRLAPDRRFRVANRICVVHDHRTKMGFLPVDSSESPSPLMGAVRGGNHTATALLLSKTPSGE